MSVIVKIEGKVNFNDLVESNIDYGVKDTAYRLCYASSNSKLVVFFDKRSIGRGIEVELLNNEIELKLSSVSTRDDVKLFYHLIKKICHKNKRSIFTREGEIENIKDIKKLLSNELKENVHSFETLIMLLKQEKGIVSIFCAKNPIDIDYGLLSYLGLDYDKYEKFICDIQHINAYYSAPFIMVDKNNKNIGIFNIHTNDSYILPVVPVLNNAEVSKDYVVDDWYIGNENGLIKYDDFIKMYKDSPLYDANHIVIEISEDNFKKLVVKYGIDLTKM